jgi:hypothetical protein
MNAKERFERMKLRATQQRAETMSATVRENETIVRAMYARGCAECGARIAGVLVDKAICSVNPQHAAGSMAPSPLDLVRMRCEVDQVVARSLARRKGR